jgi:Polysaccharide lyase
MSRRITAALAAAAVTLILASGGASGRSTAPGQQLPKNQTLPTVSGSAVVSNTLTAGTGSWQGKGLKFAYQWLRCDSAGASCSAISGATGSAETLSTADAARTLRVIVTASNQKGSTAATSAQTGVVAQASSPPPPSPGPSSGTSPVAPSDSSLPVVSGTPQQNQTLSTSTGAWSGTTPLTYAYQWQRCGSGGGSCVPISGATAASYVLVAADVGSTLRASVTASNSAGSATASSAATAAVAAPLSAPAASASGYYFNEHFDGSYNLPFWGPEGPSDFSFVSNGVSGQALRASDCASASATQHCEGMSSAYGQNVNLHAISLPNADVPHMGRVPGSGTGCCDGNGQPQETWYRFHIRFPTDYHATPGGQNVFWEIHCDDKTANVLGGCYSPVIGVRADGTACPGSPAFCTTYGTNPRFWVQIPHNGGFSQPDITPPGSLITDHWYDFVIHAIWDANAANGLFQLWIDKPNGGTPTYSYSGATKYSRPDGTQSYGEDYYGGLYYRLWASWPSYVDFDEQVWGPTAASVAFAP